MNLKAVCAAYPKILLPAILGYRPSMGIKKGKPMGLPFYYPTLFKTKRYGMSRF